LKIDQVVLPIVIESSFLLPATSPSICDHQQYIAIIENKFLKYNILVLLNKWVGFSSIKDDK